MVGYIWAFLIIIGIIYSFLTGNINVINESILTNANKALELILNLLPIIVLWTGLLKIAEDSGLLNKFANFLNPLLSKLFPEVPKDNKALGYISSNIAGTIISVQEGDTITILADAGAGGNLRANAGNTWVCVEKID